MRLRLKKPNYLITSPSVYAWNSDCCSVITIFGSVTISSGSLSEVERRRNAGRGEGCGVSPKCRLYSVFKAEKGMVGSDLLYRQMLLLVWRSVDD